jgi:hypothetical protein
MKKIFVIVTLVLLAASGCVREKYDSTGGKKVVHLQVSPDFGESRTVFEYDEAGSDGQFIRWEAGDALAVAVTADDDFYLASRFSDKLTIGGDLEDPIFSGDVHMDWFNDWTDYLLYAVYPYEAVTEDCYRIDEVKITLPTEQRPSQKGFDGKADVMVSAPYPIDLDGNEDYCRAWPVFAHVFGFGRISFDCSQHANELVRKVIIQATGVNRDLAGEFMLNLSEPVGSEDFRVEDSWDATATSRITLLADGTVPLKDYQAWFVANPGDFDVNITVVTNLHTLSYDRTGLRIRRAKITKPTIHSSTFDAIDDVKLLRSMKRNSGYGTYKYDFLYDASSRLVGILCDGATYADISYPDANTAVWSDSWTARFDEDGNIVSEDSNYGNYAYTYTYQDGHLVSVSSVSSSGWTYERNYTWQNGDISKMEANRLMNTWDGGTTFTYSDQEDRGNIFGIFINGMEHLVIRQPAFAHLPSSAAIMLDEIRLDMDFGYTFDRDGYPLSATIVTSTRSAEAYTFSWDFDEAPEPVLPDMPAFGEGQPRHVVLTDAEGTTTQFAFTYDADDRLTKAVMDGTTTYSFSYSGSTVNATVSGGVNYSLSGGSLYRNGTAVDISLHNEYSGPNPDMTGISSLLYAISEGWDAKALFPVLYAARAVSSAWPEKSGKVCWTYQTELNGLIIGIRCYERGLFKYGVSVSYTDDVPAAQKVFKPLAAPEKKLVRKISYQGSSESWSETHYYDDAGNLKEMFRIQNRWSNYYSYRALLFDRSPSRLDIPAFHGSPEGDGNIPLYYVRFDADGHAVALVYEELLFPEWANGRLVMLGDADESIRFEWTGDDFSALIDDDDDRTEVSWTSYVDRLGITGYLLDNDSGAIWRQVGLPGNAHLPASIGDITYAYTFDTDGDLSGIQVSMNGSTRGEFQIVYSLDLGPDDSSNSSGGEDYNVKPLI